MQISSWCLFTSAPPYNGTLMLAFMYPVKGQMMTSAQLSMERSC